MLFHCIETIPFLICGIPSCFIWVIRYMTIDLSFSLVYFRRETFNDLKNMNRSTHYLSQFMQVNRASVLLSKESPSVDIHI